MNAAVKKRSIIGLTGTIGSGKSFVADVLGELGVDVIDSDIIAREVVKPGMYALKAISDRWGERVLKPDGALDRESVAEIVFNDESERRWLNGLLHPIIGQEMARRIAESDADVVVLVAPLLFESGMDAMVENAWVVTTEESALTGRICARDGCSAEAAAARINTQMSQSEKARRANVVIDNSGSKESTRKQVEEALRKIEKL